MEPNEKMVSITEKEYQDLLDDRNWRLALEGGGVDNWEWYYDSLVEGGYINDDED